MIISIIDLYNKVKSGEIDAKDLRFYADRDYPTYDVYSYKWCHDSNPVYLGEIGYYDFDDILKYFFPESYQVALVVDPIREDLQFFTLEKNSEKGYKEISYAILNVNSK